MKKNISPRLIVVLLFAIFLNSSLKAQHIQFSQFYSSPTILSPSFTGLTEGSRVAINYRDQWSAIPGVFQTYSLAFDHYFPRKRSGFGLVMLRDVAGSGNFGLTNVGGLYSYNFNINRDWHIRPGIHLMYSQRSLEMRKLVFGDQFDYNNPEKDHIDITTEVFPDENKSYLDASASILAYNELLWFGFNVDHLLRPNQSLMQRESIVPMKFSVFGGGKLDITKRRSSYEESFTFSFLYKTYEKFDQLDLGFYYTKSPLVLGGWFRGLPVFRKSKNDFTSSYENIDAIIVLIGYKLPNLSIGYSYDFTISSLMTNTGGSHEISLVYEFNRNMALARRQKHAAVACPDF